MKTNEPLTPTDEQWMRERIEKWRSQGYAVDRYSLTGEAMWNGYQARDAEVQALREALESVHYRATRWAVLPTVEAHQSVLRDIGEDARTALSWGETGETE